MCTHIGLYLYVSSNSYQQKRNYIIIYVGKDGASWNFLVTPVD